MSCSAYSPATPERQEADERPGDSGHDSAAEMPCPSLHGPVAYRDAGLEVIPREHALEEDSTPYHHQRYEPLYVCTDWHHVFYLVYVTGSAKTSNFTENIKLRKD